MKNTTLNGLNRLVITDFRLTYSHIVSLAEDIKFAVEDVQQAYKAVVAHNELLQTTMTVLPSYEQTVEKEQLKERHKQSIRELKYKVKCDLKSSVAGEREAAGMLNEWMKNERQFLKSADIEEQIKSAERIKQELALIPELMKNSRALGLNEVIDSLIGTTRMLDENNKRQKAEQKARTMRANTVRHEAYVAMQTFVVAMEQAIRLEKGDENIHRKCLMRIENIVNVYHAQHKSKITRAKNSKLKSE